MGAFSDFSGISQMQERILVEAARYQDMVDKAECAVGGRAVIELVQSNRQVLEMLEKVRRPELHLAQEMRDLASGVTAQRESLEAAAALSNRHMLHLGNTAKALLENASGALSLHAAAERLARDGAGVEAFRRAAEEHQSHAQRLVQGAEHFVTMNALVREQAVLRESIAASIKNHSILGVSESVKAAMAINTPWIDRADPMGSIAGFAALSEIGKTMAELNTDYFVAAEHLRSLVGNWAPPAGFAFWDEVRRFEAFAESGIDPNILGIPDFAFPDVAFASGIVVPVPSVEHDGKAKSQSPKVIVPVNSSIKIDAHEHVQCAELLIRHRLSWVMTAKHGANWPKHVIHGTVLFELKLRHAKMTQLGKSPAILDYATFGELLAIAMRKDVWAAAFSDLPMCAEEFRVCVERLIEVRNAVDHGRDLDPTEFLWAFAESTRLQRAFGVPSAAATLGE